MKEIIYSVATEYTNNTSTAKLVYGKVSRKDDICTITNRCGQQLTLDVSTINSLIAALQEITQNV